MGLKQMAKKSARISSKISEKMPKTKVVSKRKLISIEEYEKKMGKIISRCLPVEETLIAMLDEVACKYDIKARKLLIN
jgi:hypothetical protein